MILGRMITHDLRVATRVLVPVAQPGFLMGGVTCLNIKIIMYNVCRYLLKLSYLLLNNF